MPEGDKYQAAALAYALTGLIGSKFESFKKVYAWVADDVYGSEDPCGQVKALTVAQVITPKLNVNGFKQLKEFYAVAVEKWEWTPENALLSARAKLGL